MATITAFSQAIVAPPLGVVEFEAYLDRLRNAQPPIPEMTWEQYREYQSWRIQLQMIAMQFATYQKVLGGEKMTLKTRIQELVTRANLRITRFPPQGLPQDLIQPVKFDFLSTDTGTEYWLSRMLNEMNSEFANEIVVNIPVVEAL